MLGNAYKTEVGRIMTSSGATFSESEQAMLDPKEFLKDPAALAWPGEMTALFKAQKKLLNDNFRIRAKQTGLEFVDEEADLEKQRDALAQPQGK
jgi:hypothetical protein